MAVLADGVNGALVTTVADGGARRLQVESRSNLPIGLSLVNTYLLNKGSNNMQVNGSASFPIKFSYSPPMGSTATILSVSMIFTAGTVNFGGSSKFLNADALTAGIQVGVSVGALTRSMALIKSNEDIVLFSGSGGGVTGQAGGLAGGGNKMILSYFLGFSQALGPTDSVFIAIQDNLTPANTGNNLVSLTSACEGFLN